MAIMTQYSASMVERATFFFLGAPIDVVTNKEYNICQCGCSIISITSPINIIKGMKMRGRSFLKEVIIIESPFKISYDTFIVD